MTVAAKRWMTWVLAVAAAYQGVWAAAFPLSFYQDFPGPGLHWVAMLGPYNEHLVRDVGALNLALLALSGWALRRRTQEAMVVTGGARVIYNAIHFLWHALHLEVFGTIDKISVVGILGGLLVLSLLLMLPVKEPTPLSQNAVVSGLPLTTGRRGRLRRTGRGGRDRREARPVTQHSGAE